VNQPCAADEGSNVTVPIGGFSGALVTRRWRKPDSKHRYRRMRPAACSRRLSFTSTFSVWRESSRGDMSLSKPRSRHAVPAVRISLAGAG
jgi:hypothetical protein